MRRRGASLRLRLTLSYGVVFFIVALLLLSMSYLLVRRVLIAHPDHFRDETATELHLSPAYLGTSMPARPGTAPQTVGSFMRTVQDQVFTKMLHGVLFISFWALGLAAVVSVGLGWLVAGRMLRPLHEIITVTQRLSASTLNERIALQGPRDELRELADTFDAMLARLEATFASQREFVANASHELRTPLAIMRTELDVTLADPAVAADDLRHMAETIRAAIARSADIVDKLLVLAESEKLTDIETIDLQALVSDSVQRYRHLAAARNLSFELHLGPARVHGDVALLERLIDNLLDNATRYSPPGETVQIDIAGDRHAASLRVANAGDVIASDELPRLFERFYRRGTSRSRATGGSGLGLAIVAAVAKVHGGDVSAASLPEGGLVVLVTLPAESNARATSNHLSSPPGLSGTSD
ncbi:MAG: sensor histidine kinase [Thermoleophilia bacterium]